MPTNYKYSIDLCSFISKFNIVLQKNDRHKIVINAVLVLKECTVAIIITLVKEYI